MCDAPRISRAEIACAVPAGAALTRSGKAFLAALEADPAVCAMRAHGRRNLMAVAAEYATHLSRRDGTSWPGHDCVQAATGLAESTVKRHVRWLREHRWLGTVRQGSTPATRRGARPGDGNEAAVYCLAIPRSPRSPARESRQSGPPTSRRRKSLLLEDNPRARTRAGTPPSARPRPEQWRGGTVGRIPLPALMAIAGPFTRAGWAPADVVYAIDHQPDGTAHWHSRQVRNPGGWARHRLSLWILPDGTPALPRSRQLLNRASEHRRLIAEQERYAPVAARTAVLRASGVYPTAAEPRPEPGPATPRAELLAALHRRLGPAVAITWARNCAADQVAESRRSRGAAA